MSVQTTTKAGVVWRVIGMQTQYEPRFGCNQFLTAAPAFVVRRVWGQVGRCLSCGETLEVGQRYRCRACATACELVWNAEREGVGA